MPWDSSPEAGFTQAKPWLPLGADHPTVNVASLFGQRDSILSLYRTLIRLRRANEALISGRLEGVAANGRVLRYERRNEQQHFAILLNLGHAQEDRACRSGCPGKHGFRIGCGRGMAGELRAR